MSSVLAVCPFHGAFPSRAFSIDQSTNVTLTNNSESCPQCGARSRIMEGTFNFRNGLVEVLTAPSWTRDVLRDISRTVQRASGGLDRTSSDEDLNAQIQQLSIQITAMNEDLGRMIRQQTQGKSKAWVKWFLGALCTILMWLYTAEDVGNYNKDVIGPMVEQILHHTPEP